MADTLSRGNAPLSERNPLPATLPRDDTGAPIEPAPYFHDWDDTPHAIFPTVGLGAVELGDVVLGGTHQVEGKGRAEQRGTAAVRLDLNYLVGQTMESSARLILPVDHQLEVKRYFPEALGRFRYAWTKDVGGDRPAALVPDYGSQVQLCCGFDHGPNDDLNPHGFGAGSTMCNSCVDSWELDYEVVRHIGDVVRPRT